MSGLLFDASESGVLVGLKGPRAAEWLTAHGIVLPAAPNSWAHSPSGGAARLLVARLGHTEFFLEDAAPGAELLELGSSLAAGPPGVYPVLREDFGFQLGGEGVHDALAQVCNVNFAAIDLESQPVIMTLMIGVAVLVVPEGPEADRRYRFWCDPTYGPSFRETLGAVIVECGGTVTSAAGP